jgi:hypothetical protein
MLPRIGLSFILAMTSTALFAAPSPLREKLAPATCGSMYAPPFADRNDAGRRTCGAPGPRNYTSKHRGIGFDILNLESEACFVPDASYRLLDDIVDTVVKRLSKANPPANPPQDSGDARVGQVLKVSQITGDVLAEKGFGLYIPTHTLGDALEPRNAAGEEPRHIIDCDASSFILLTVADSLSLPASLVEITLPGGSGHNYVRWQVSPDTAVDWDTNGRAQCTTPTNIPSFQGKSMSRDQTLSYALTLRVPLWKSKGLFDRAVGDYREAIRLFPEHPYAYNNFAWLVATKDFQGRAGYKNEAVAAASKAVAINRTPDYLDTLACAYAFTGDFAQAAAMENEALAGEPSNKEFSERLKQFQASSPKDCTGA